MANLPESLRRAALFTVDVEYPGLKPDVGVDNFLRLLDAEDAVATFFVTGDVARARPDMVRRIVNAGHEVASHGHRHDPPFLLDRPFEEAQEEVRLSRVVFDDLGVPVRGFRAPAFNVNERILGEVARWFDYDSSVVNFIVGSGRYSNLCGDPGMIGDLLEIPVSVFRRLKVPVGSSPLMGLGVAGSRIALSGLGVTWPFVFYAHSYDLAGFEHPPFPIKRWKRLWYYRRCGPGQAPFFASVLDYMKRHGGAFYTMSRFADEYRASSAGNGETAPPA